MNTHRSLAFTGKYGTLLFLAVMVIVLSILEPTSFMSGKNFLNIINQASIGAIVAAGLTFPLVVGEFDLSIGYHASFAGIVGVGLVANNGLNPLLACGIVMVLGAIIGLLNGLIITQLQVNALIATLGTGTILIGFNYAYSSGIPISARSEAGFTSIAQGTVLGLPNTIWYMILVLSVLWIILNRTVIGQSLQAVGGNSRASELSGIRVNRTRTIAFVISGVAAAFGGFLLASRIGSGQVTAGDGYLLQSFAAVFLGSAVLRDGEFHIVGTLVGVVTVGVGFNGIAILGAPTYVQYIFQGALLVAAVALATTARRFSLSAKQGAVLVRKSSAPKEKESSRG